MDEVDKLREAMAAAVRKLGGRPILVQVAEDPRKLGITPEELAAFETSMQEAAGWIRSRELLGDNEPIVELLAIVSAVGAVLAQDHDKSIKLAILLAYRLVTATEQVAREQP